MRYDILATLAVLQSKVFNAVQTGLLDSDTAFNTLERLLLTPKHSESDTTTIDEAIKAFDCRTQSSLHIQPVDSQLDALLGYKCFSHLDKPGLSLALASEVEGLRAGNKSVLLIPKPSRIGADYCESVRLVFQNLQSAFAESRINCTIPFIGGRLRLTARAELAHRRWTTIFPGDFLVLHVQFGTFYQGMSIDSVRRRIIRSEAELGLYEILVAMLTHTRQFLQPQWSGVYASGCECADEEYGRFSTVPYILHEASDAGRGIRRSIAICTGRTSVPDPRLGCATAIAAMKN